MAKPASGRPNGQSRWRAAASRQRRIQRTATLFVLMALAIVFMFPFLWAVTASLKPLGKVYEYPPRLTVSDPQWSNYAEALSKLPFFRFITNTFVIALANVAGQVLTASMVGYAFARLRWRGRGVFFIVLLATMMLPGQVLLIPHFLIYQSLGWVNTYKPLIVPGWLGGGAFFIFLFRQFFKAIPRELEEAALIDGASRWQLYWQIMLPLAKPAVATVAVLSFIGHWQEFMSPLIYLSDFQKYPISLGLRMYQAMEGGSMVHYLMAASLVAVVPVLILFFLAQRYFVRGLLLTGLKA